MLGAAAALPVAAAFAPPLAHAAPLLPPAAAPALAPAPAPAAIPLPAAAARHADAASSWSLLRTAFRDAQAAVCAAERASAGLPFAEAEALQEEYDRCLDRLEDALARLLTAPAPDLPALGLKIALIVDHDAGSLADGDFYLAALRRDAPLLCWGCAGLKGARLQ
ncbi:MAG TPA: hypothetical protein VIA98_12920 [Allosphingosinicella sp.]|jgi:hypothetical protein